MKVRIYTGIIVGMLLVALSGCKTSKTVLQDGQSTESQLKSEKEDINYLRKISDNYQYANNITAKMKFSAGMDGQSIGLSGSLKMQRDNVIQISLVALGIIEAARMEFTPEYAMIIDRIHKRYVKEKYDNIDFLKSNGLDFYSLQALFWDELFCPGVNKIGEGNLTAFSLSHADKSPKITLKESAKPQTGIMKSTVFGWTTDKDNSKITSVAIQYTDEQKATSHLTWGYSSFKMLSKRLFPMQHDIDIKTPHLNIKANITLNDADNDNDWETRTNLSGKYTKVTVEEIFKSLGQ